MQNQQREEAHRVKMGKAGTCFWEPHPSGVMQDVLNSSSAIATICVKCRLPGKFLTDQVPTVLLLGWSHRHPCLSLPKSQIPRRKAGSQHKHTVCTSSLSAAGLLGTLPEPSSQVPASSQACRQPLRGNTQKTRGGGEGVAFSGSK